MKKPFPLWKWFWLTLGTLYFTLPLLSTLIFSLKKQRDVLSFAAYESAFSDPQFFETFGFSIQLALLTIVFGVLLIVPTAFWVHLYLPKFRPVMEVLTLMPFVIPAIILVFGIIGMYSRPPLLLTVNKTTTIMLLVAGYIVLSLPYMYRSVDLGLRAMDVRGLTEAAQSLGASWPRILFTIILPNLRTALLSGALLTLAIVVGEITLATFLGLPTFGPYLFLVGQHYAYEPAALSLVSFGLTWVAMGLISVITSGVTGRQAQIAGGH
jgi:putative spermidine/putrescine transport system permease protein